MEDPQKSAYALTVHAGHGSIYRVGEFVQRGCIVGMSVDCRSTVVAPVSGWLQSAASSADGASVVLEIAHAPVDD